MTPVRSLIFTFGCWRRKAAMIGGRMSGKLGRSLPQKNLVVSGLTIAFAANGVLYFLGYQLEFLILGVTLLGFGLMLAHSTLLTIATEFAAQARGAAISLAALFINSPPPHCSMSSFG